MDNNEGHLYIFRLSAQLSFVRATETFNWMNHYIYEPFR